MSVRDKAETANRAVIYTRVSSKGRLVVSRL